MAYDANGGTGTLVTASTNLNGPTIDCLNTPGSARWGYVGRVSHWSDNVATLGISYYFQAQQSTDGTAWTNLYQSDTYTPGTATNYYNKPLDLPVIMTKRYLRFNIVLSNTTGTPLIAYQVDLGTEFPG